MVTVPAAEARAMLGRLLDRAHAGEVVEITQNGRRTCVLIDAALFDRLAAAGPAGRPGRAAVAAGKTWTLVGDGRSFTVPARTIGAVRAALPQDERRAFADALDDAAREADAARVLDRWWYRCLGHIPEIRELLVSVREGTFRGVPVGEAFGECWPA
jgi:prevent-host-death family protein